MRIQGVSRGVVTAALLVVGACVSSAPEEALPEPTREPSCLPAADATLEVPGALPPPFDEASAALAPWPTQPSAAEDEDPSPAIEEARGTDADELLAEHAVPREPLPYDPMDAANLPLVQGSELALDRDERAVLAARGFVISDRQSFPTFVQGYEAIYGADLPLFVSADSLLHALHHSFDDILLASERRVLAPELGELLDGLRAAAAAEHAAGGGSETLAWLDTYLAVAHGLLAGEPSAPVAGGDPETARRAWELGQAADGLGVVELFGAARNVDFSQLKPRGHYAGTLEGYFRAMMWLGRIDLRVVDTTPDGSLEVSRPYLAGALALHRLAEAAGADGWRRIDRIVGGFMGSREGLSPGEVAEALASVGVRSEADLPSVADGVLLEALLAAAEGRRRIASDLLVRGPLAEDPLPLPVGVALFGQRYAVDSEVLSNLVFDRVGGGSVERWMPSPLDVAFAALGNDDAARLLEPELRTYPYAPDLAATRAAVDAHGAAFWQADPYHLWLRALRSLSPREVDPATLPAVARTEGWGRRMLNAQLASWAELRHDTLLYAAQSYSGGSTCDYPEAYVEPVPAFFDQLAAVAEGFTALEEALRADEELATAVGRWAAHFTSVSRLLGAMAERQTTGLPLTEEQLAFINRAVRTREGCGSISGAVGWYPELFFDGRSSYEPSPSVADVHTQPYEHGTLVGRVLHVGSGHPRLMAVTFESCTGPRLYVGLASSYFEMVTRDFERLDDAGFRHLLRGSPPDDVPWMRDLVVRWPRCPAD